MQKKISQQPESSQDSVDSDRWQDPINKALGKPETRGRVMGVGYGARWADYCPQTREVARERRKAKQDKEFDARVEAAVKRILGPVYEQLRRPPMHPDTQPPPLNLDTQPPPFTAARSSSPSVSGIGPGSPNSIDGLTVSVVGSTNRSSTSWFRCSDSNIDDASTRIYVSQVITPCHLQAQVLGSMVTVAHGRVHPITPENKMHCVDLPPNLARVELTKVVGNFEDLVLNDPPEEGYEKLGACKGFFLRWPKDAIKLIETSNRATPSPSHTHSQSPRPSPLGLCPPLSYRDLEMESADEGAEHGMPRDKEAQLFEDTPPTQHDKQARSKLTPNTLMGAAKEAMAGQRAVSLEPQRTRQKGAKKTQASTGTSDRQGEARFKKSLTYPASSQSRPGATGRQWRAYHVPGHPMVPRHEFDILPNEMKILHENIRQVELAPDENNVSYYTVKVPEGFHFVDQYPADKFYLEFAEIFAMFNLYRLEASLVRLWALYQARETRRLNHPDVGIADPYHMHENNVRSEQGREIMKEYLVSALLAHKGKDYLLVPYNPM